MQIKKTLLLIILIFPVVSIALLGAVGTREIQLDKTISKIAVTGETDTTVSFREYSGNIVELPKNPQRVIVCLNSIMDIWYMAGGKSLARVKGSINVPEEAIDLPILGGIRSLNSELIMELEPDLLIVSGSDYQMEIRDFFEDDGVPGVTIQYSSYDDFRVILDLFTRLTENREQYEEELLPSHRQVQSIINQVPEGPPPTVCIIFSSTKYVKVETPNTVTGDYCAKLGAENIYKETTIEGAARVSLSLEYILEQDPDYIFVTTMGDVEKCRARVDRDITSSDIWGDLTAVKNDRFIYLDKSFSVYKPNRAYPEAFKTMAEYLYPDIEFVLAE